MAKSYAGYANNAKKLNYLSEYDSGGSAAKNARDTDKAYKQAISNKTIIKPKPAASSSGYVPTYGTNGLYTSAGNTAPKVTQPNSGSKSIPGSTAAPTTTNPRGSQNRPSSVTSGGTGTSYRAGGTTQNALKAIAASKTQDLSNIGIPDFLVERAKFLGLNGFGTGIGKTTPQPFAVGSATSAQPPDFMLANGGRNRNCRSSPMVWLHHPR